MKISDVRIGVKLGLGFFAIVLLTLALGMVSLVQLSRMNAQTSNIAEQLLPGVAHAGELRVLVNRMRRAEAGLITALVERLLRSVPDCELVLLIRAGRMRNVTQRADARADDSVQPVQRAKERLPEGAERPAGDRARHRLHHRRDDADDGRGAGVSVRR